MGKLITLRPGEAVPGERFAGVDIIKIIAMYSVLSLHFCDFGGFYDFPVRTPSGVILSAFRTIFYMCVPLFLTITGFLMHKAEFCARHYIKSIPFIVNSYVVGIIVIIFKMKYFDEKWPLFIWLKSLYTFQQPHYGWYVNMYLCLFMLMPFFNYAFKCIRTPGGKLGALFVLLILGNVASTVNRIPIHLEIGDTYIGFTPHFFENLWPVPYYWCGMLIAEYRPKVNKLFAIFMTLFIIDAEVIINLLTTKVDEGLGWYHGFTFNNDDFLNVFLAAFMFLIFYDIKIRNKVVCRILSAVSGLSMTVYLISFIGDTVYSKRFIQGDNSPLIFVQRYFRIIPLHFLCAVLASFIISFIVKLISKLLMKPLLKLADRKKPAGET